MDQARGNPALAAVLRLDALNQYACKVSGWEHHGSLLAVRVVSGTLSLVALITFTSFQHLEIREGIELYATFKSSAVHCF